jgi:ubiquinone/menaquinone biosynthesis C-methylase UbiE
MFRKLVAANPTGQTVGLDLSPKMSARTQYEVRKRFPGARAFCQAVDVRNMPFRDGSFDSVMCCFLFELLPDEDILSTISEIRRVLRSGGTFTVVLIGQNSPGFNQAYKFGGKIAPSFWGRQVEYQVEEMLRHAGLRIASDERVKQGFYPSRVLVTRKP